jgi:heme/copper-type cytochrome/quinol oxidase subunit 3
MRLMLLPDDYCMPVPRPPRPRVPFEVGMALLILALCVLYGLVFGAMVYVSVQEQVVSPHVHAPGLAGLPHFHSPAEWALLLFPTVIAWSGTLSSLRYLVARARRRL